MRRHFQKIPDARFRLIMAVAASVLVPIGLACKYYDGPGGFWVRNAFAGVLYEIFWCAAVAFVWPRRAAWEIAVSVFLATCVVEFLQLWHPAWLEAIRGTFVGRTLLGTTFAWSDFPHYAAGCLLGWALLSIGAKSRSDPRPTG